MPFKKGQSGNPQGRRVEKISDAIAKKFGPEAIEIIADLMRNSPEERVRLDAAKYLSDRAFGKAAQSVELSGKEGGPLLAVIRDA